MSSCRKIYIILVVLGFSFGSFLPSEGQMVNYIHIFFKWPQISDADHYKVEISGENYFNQVDSQVNSVIIDNFDWGNQYSWVVCGVDQNDDVIGCHGSKSFETNVLPDNYPDQVEVSVLSSSEYTPGVTVLDYESLGFSVALNMEGYPVWFAVKENFNNSKISVTQFLSNGNLVGFGVGKGYEFDLNSEVLFQTTNGYGVHHYIHKTDRGTYFLVDAEVENNPCPAECDPSLPNEIPWLGDRFLEVDSEGAIVWEWNTFDQLSLDEYNPLWVNLYSGNGTFDWTHANSVYLDPMTSLVYVSLRNLSRITAIDYDSKDIVWNLGNSEFMDEPSFEDDFGFSHQHSAQITDSGNLIFFDNGRDNFPELSRCLEIDFSNQQSPSIVWEYTLPDSMLTLSRGECDRLTSGNALISAGRTGNVIEVNNEKQIVWHLNVKESSAFLNNQSVSIFRSERVLNLYPSAFSFELDNLQGELDSYYIDSYSGSLDFAIHNQGWHAQEFNYGVKDSEGSMLLESSVYIDSNSSFLIQQNIDLSGNGLYNLEVSISDNSSSLQSIQFAVNSMPGDINNDGILNVLDVIQVVNIVLANEYNQVADFNSDGTIDILDVIQLVNIIIQ